MIVRKVVFDHFSLLILQGPVSFNGPDRYGITVFRQNQRGNMARVALYFPENGSLCFDCEGTNPIIWEGKASLFGAVGKDGI